MRKEILLTATTLVLLCITAGCSGKKTAETAVTDPNGLDWDSTCAPMPIYGVVTFYEETDQVEEFYLLHIHNSNQDSATYAPVADSYHVVYCDGDAIRMKYSGFQNGPETGSVLNSVYGKYMKGFRYEKDEEETFYKGDGIAFSDTFLAKHTVVTVNCYATGEAGEYDIYEGQGIPAAVLDTLKARYGMEVQSSHVVAEAPEANLSVYALQMEPKDNRALGLRVVTIGDTLYTQEEWANDLDGELNWNVDDDGVYHFGHVCAITRGELGYDVFFQTTAPESVTYSALLLRNGKANEVVLANYYNYVDYSPQPETVSLPEGAQLKAELDGYKVWIHTDQQPVEDCPEGVYSVYYSRPEGKEVYHLVTTGTHPDALQTSMKDALYVTAEDLNTAQEAFIAKKAENGYTEYRLILQGCPDARNVYCFAISLPVESVNALYRWIRCYEGYQGQDQQTGLLMFDDYRYHDEGGRYSIRKYFDFNLDEVKEETLPE